MKKFRTSIAIVILCFILLLAVSLGKKEEIKDPLLIQDVSRLMLVKVKEVQKGREKEGLIKAVKEASDKNLKISIAGKHHSQGGHSFYHDSLQLDMTSFNKILNLNKEKKTIQVQSGATWEDIQDYVNPHGLSVKVMQSSNIFTVGGSLSVNAHGRDLRYGPIIETVNSFRLLKPDGKVVNVSRTENPDLFELVIGGYGLFGVILDVELQLTDDVLYEVKSDWMDYSRYPEYFKEKVLKNQKNELHIARLSTTPDNFLATMYATNYQKIDKYENKTLNDFNELKDETYIRRNQFLFGLGRKYDWGKELTWKVQKIVYGTDKKEYISRNNAMRPEIHFLEYHGEKNTDNLQEYFIPIEQYTHFVDDMRKILRNSDINLLNITVRFVSKNEEAFINYAKEDMFALALLINHGFTEKEVKKATEVIQELIDATHQNGGTYFLPYYQYPTKLQSRISYPNLDLFFKKKREYDPKELFMNMFYEGYK